MEILKKKSDNKIRFLLLFYLQNVFLDYLKQFIYKFRLRSMKIYVITKLIVYDIYQKMDLEIEK